MGGKYTVTAWGMHDGDDFYSDRTMWSGQKLIPALYNLWKYSRMHYGCVTLECR